MQCANCGNTLYIGQRFCRSCGAATGQYDEENLPTQKMPEDGSEVSSSEGWPHSPQGGWQTNTAPAGRPNTTPVYPNQPYYDSQLQPQYPVGVYPQKSSRSPWGWILAFLGIGLFAAIFLAALIFSKINSNQRAPRSFMPPPTVPSPGESAFSDDAAIVTGDSTTYSQSFPLDSDGSFSLTGLSGPISVEGWDEDTAEVTVIKRGGSARDRKATQVFFANEALTPDRNKLSLRIGGGVSSRVDVEFQVKLPHDIKFVTVSSSNATLKVHGINGRVSLSTSNGSIELSGDVTEADVKTTNGSIKAVLSGDGVEGPMSFQAVNGSVSLELGPDFNGNLDAVADIGSINIDGELPLTIEKRIVGQRASGKIGEGGEALTVRSKTGSIKIRKPAAE